MNTRLTLSLLAIVLTSTLALPASAGGLYKSIDADGVLVVSDIPPPPDASIVTQSTGGPIAVTKAPGMPYYEPSEFAESDAVVRANEQVDLAEHALALARQGHWTPHDGLRLVSVGAKQGDGARVAFYKKGVQNARAQLIALRATARNTP